MVPPPRKDTNYDAYPEVENGDIDSLKDYANDDDGIGSAVINALIKAHCYWIREADGRIPSGCRETHERGCVFEILFEHS